MTILNDIQVWTTACAYDRLIPGRGVGVLLDDGTQAALDQLKEGDEVRASLDPSSNQATKLEVQSKGKDKDKHRGFRGHDRGDDDVATADESDGDDEPKAKVKGKDKSKGKGKAKRKQRQKRKRMQSLASECRAG